MLMSPIDSKHCLVRAGLSIGTIFVVCLALSACGGSSKDKASSQTTSASTSSSAEGATDPASVQRCLTDAGFEVVAGGDLPIVERSKALGVRLPAGGNIMPGSLSAAIFWYGSSADATSVMKNDATMFKALMQFDKIVVAYDPIPPADAQNKIEACIPRV
jgi:hypothetical protein